MLLVCIGVLALLVVGEIRSAVKRRFERATLARRPLGPDGVIVGAESIDRGGGAGRGAILLLHGFADTPQSLGPLAAELHRRGWTIRAPLLPGHGRTLPIFARSRAQEWIDAARAEYAALRVQHNTVGLAGLSMGGALATILAAEQPDTVALVLLAPYVAMPFWLRLGTALHWPIDLVLPYVGGGDSRSILNRAIRVRSLAHNVATARLGAELASVAQRAWAALPRVTVPTLILQSRADNRIAPAVAERALDRLGTTERRLIWMTQGGHIITVDDGAAEVACAAGEWFDAQMSHRIGSPVSYDTQSVAQGTR